MKTALFGLAKSESQAASIVDQLKVAGFFGDDIAVLSSEGTSTTRQFAHEQHSKAPEGAAIGGGIGVIVGTTLGWLVGGGTVALPALGLLVAAGPIIAALACAGAGAIIGGILGSMIGLQIPEFEALQYDDKMHGGNILLSVLTENRTERKRAKGIFKNAGAVTAAEGIVDHAHGKPAASVPLV